MKRRSAFSKLLLGGSSGAFAAASCLWGDITQLIRAAPTGTKTGDKKCRKAKSSWFVFALAVAAHLFDSFASRVLFSHLNLFAYRPAALFRLQRSLAVWIPKMDLPPGERESFLVDLLSLVFSCWKEKKPPKATKSRGRSKNS